VSELVRSALAALRTERALERRLLAALPHRVSRQGVLAAVRARTRRARERAARPRDAKLAVQTVMICGQKRRVLAVVEWLRVPELCGVVVSTD
jgi:hypothetical protein